MQNEECEREEALHEDYPRTIANRKVLKGLRDTMHSGTVTVASEEECQQQERFLHLRMSKEA